MEDIDTVKDIVNLGRSIRNKANLKIRQPLKDIKIFLDKVLILYQIIIIRFLKN